jgi:hypothetical protein
MLKNRYADPEENKTCTGSDSFFYFHMLQEKPRKTLLFSSFEKYAQ